MVRKIHITLLVTLITALYGCAVRQADVDGGAAQTLFSAYHGPLNSLSGVRGAQCPMFPSCSEYMRRAILKHGVVKGWLMGTERLMRCGHEDLRQLKTVRINGAIKIYDPLDHNDFWWSESSKSPAQFNPL